MKEIDDEILAIGETVVDELVILPDYPQIGEKIESSQEIFSIGGTVCLISLFLAKMGLKVNFFTSLGKDIYGWQIKRFLEKNQIKLNISWQIKTIKNLILVARGKRTIIKKKTNKKIIDFISWDFIKKSKVVVIDRHNLHLLNNILSNKNKETLILFDPSTIASLFYVNALKYLDFVIIPKEFLDNFYLKKEFLFKEKINDFFNIVKKPLIITANDEGVFWIEEKSKIFHLPAAFSQVIDPTGAGDIFRAGFIYFFIKTKNLVDSIIFANIVAGHQCLRIGSSNAVPSKSEIFDFIKKNPIKSFYKKINLI